MAWIAFAIGWILGGVSLYTYIVLTATEPDKQECMDCTQAACIECPSINEAKETSARRAA